ncbi:MAG: HAD family hydrolase [Ruminococcaceae bacterium]|nr:HAD family hydrolase [Oscillospiraceae bacterium]
MIKAVIFDLDGTLADTLEDLMTAMNGMLRHFGWPERTLEELRSFINRGARVFVARSMPEGSWNNMNDPVVDEAIEVYNGCYDLCFNDKTAPFPGVPEAVARLKDAGLGLGVLSNKQDFFVKPMSEKLFPGTFDVIRGQGEYPEKPEPTSAVVTARELGAEPDECVFVGDSDIDMKTAVNAGMYPIGVAWGYREPELLLEAGAAYIADTPEDLAEHILRMSV